MSIAMGTRLHINLYIYKTTSVPILVLLSQNAQSYPLAAVLFVIIKGCQTILEVGFAIRSPESKMATKISKAALIAII